MVKRAPSFRGYIDPNKVVDFRKSTKAYAIAIHHAIVAKGDWEVFHSSAQRRMAKMDALPKKLHRHIQEIGLAKVLEGYLAKEFSPVRPISARNARIAARGAARAARLGFKPIPVIDTTPRTITCLEDLGL